MEFGIFNGLYTPREIYDDLGDQWAVEHQRLRNEIDWTVAADRAGFKYTWATEHHFLTEYSHLSANECFLSYLAAKTERIHLGSGIINVTPPVNHPARVAERVAFIDQLSEGRFEFGVGRGSSSTEQRGFGIEDPEDTKLMVDEVLPQFKRMWRENDYSFDGEFFSIPPRNVLPKPFQDPHPPMWMAAGNPGTFEKAGRMGLGILCFTMGTPDELAPLIEIYKKAIEDADPVGEYVNNNVMVASQMMCMEDGQRARDLAVESGGRYQNSLVFHYLDTFPKPDGVPDWPDLLPAPTAAQVDEDVRAGNSCIGTPEEVSRAVQRYADVGVDQLVFGMLATTTAMDDVIEATETFGKHVIPEFDTEPIHSTTRQREAYVAGRGPVRRTLGHAPDSVPVV